jgi:hypothetical protein
VIWKKIEIIVEYWMIWMKIEILDEDWMMKIKEKNHANPEEICQSRDIDSKKGF